MNEKVPKRCDVCGKFRKIEDLGGMSGENEEWFECGWCMSGFDYEQHYGKRRRAMDTKMSEEELRAELRAEISEFVLWTDNTPESNEPMELESYLDPFGGDITDRLTDTILEFINQYTLTKQLEARIETLMDVAIKPEYRFEPENYHSLISGNAVRKELMKLQDQPNKSKGE